MSKRPGLGSLPFATKPGTKVPPEPVEPEVVATVDEQPDEVAAPPKRRGGRKPKPNSDDRVTIILRVSPEDRKSLKAISVERDTTIQELLHRSVKDIIRRSARD